MKNRTRCIMLLSLCLLSQIVSPDEVDKIIANVDKAMQDDRYTEALALLEDGEKAWPMDTRVLMRAGGLYMDRELYRLALAKFRQADELDPDNPHILYKVSMAHGYLGNNVAAVTALEVALGIAEDKQLWEEIIDDLSWMYFKTFRMNDGIMLLEQVLEDDFNRVWAHTLGTLYYGNYDIDQARYWYNRSIEDALDSGDERFASVAYYNLALLELSFYHYKNSQDYAQRSLELQDRAGGHLVIGELSFMEWKLKNAINSYRQAESMDTTPLSRVDTAEFYRRIGRLDEAIRFIDKVNAEGDDSWMYRYGVDTVRFDMDLTEILSAAWKGKAEVELLTPRWGRGSRIVRFIRAMLWKARGVYNDMRYRALTARYVGELKAEGNVLDSEWYAFRLNQGYVHSAMRHLEKARQLETALTPLSIPWYMLEAGIEKEDSSLIEQAFSTFQSTELEPIERGLKSMAENLPRKQRLVDGLLTDLYSLNQGGLRQYGLTLPFRINVASASSMRLKRKIRKVLNSAGYRIVRDKLSTAATLTVSVRKDGLYWFIADPQGRTVSEAYTGLIKKKEVLADTLAGLLNRFYSVDID